MSGRGRVKLGVVRPRRTYAYLWMLAIFVSLIICILGDKAHALPWDIDMYKQESFRAGEMVRAPAKGTVPLGFSPFSMSTEEAAEKLENPSPMGTNSVWRGQRLYNANCLTCHGKSGGGEGPVGLEGSLGVPSLLTDFYKSSADGKVFAVIYNGGANMPRYGYKFSHEEIWDIVNYLKFLQGQDVSGIKRPKPAETKTNKGSK